MTTVIARRITRMVVPLMVLVSVSFFLQGHNLPGGGFIAGVMTAAALSLVYLVFDREGVKQVYGFGTGDRILPSYIDGLGAGLLIAAGTGVAAVILGYPFLTHGHGAVEFLTSNIHLSTALLFDLGVYVVVVASLISTVEVIGLR
jgi:multicomponent Na+:H+ antiporter subunit B